jgi:hypothetical protein
MKLGFAAEPFDRRDLAPIALGGQHQARKHTPPIDQHRAGSARALVAALLGAGKCQSLTEDIQQRVSAGDTQLIRHTIN